MWGRQTGERVLNQILELFGIVARQIIVYLRAYPSVLSKRKYGGRRGVWQVKNVRHSLQMKICGGAAAGTMGPTGTHEGEARK